MTATVYDGPTVVSTLTFAGQSVRLVRPADPDRLLDHPDVLAWNRRDDYMPYWAYLWPGAFLLAEAVAGETRLVEGQSALEIGCGLGLAGLVALGRGLSVRFTDYDEAPLSFVARSVAENRFDASKVTYQRLDWRELPEERFPVILGADVLYERRLVPLVANLLDRMLSPDGIALIADPYRAAAEEFPDRLAKLGLTCETSDAVGTDVSGVTVQGSIRRIWRG